jgi:DNA-binding transcriptional regulator YiaG
MKAQVSNPYHYKECGLDNVYLVGGVEYVDTPRGKGVTIKDQEKLHRVIGEILIKEKKKLNGKEFRFLRHELNMTQLVLASLLGVDVQTIGRWERGESEIPGSAQAILRLLYEETFNGNQRIREPLNKLAELDEQFPGCDEITLEDAEDGWQAAA